MEEGEGEQARLAVEHREGKGNAVEGRVGSLQRTCSPSTFSSFSSFFSWSANLSQSTFLLQPAAQAQQSSQLTIARNPFNGASRTQDQHLH